MTQIDHKSKRHKSWNNRPGRREEHEWTRVLERFFVGFGNVILEKGRSPYHCI
ncbi:MAG: hypothetical protein ACKPGJ_18155 [Dolichospermum sp.]